MSVRGNVRYFTTGQLARLLNCYPWQLQKLFDRRLVDEPQRVGNVRMYSEADVPAIRVALRRCGYTAEASHAAS
jgi:DNA-binding transcriptional MerR regulator